MNLIKGLFGAFRNTTAHAPKIHWQITEQDALDILTTISLIHRRLDSAVRTQVRREEIVRTVEESEFFKRRPDFDRRPSPR